MQDRRSAYRDAISIGIKLIKIASLFFLHRVAAVAAYLVILVNQMNGPQQANA